METSILNPKVQFLLGAGLAVLHFESNEWLDTIAFWKDEVKFFDNLLKQKDVTNNDPLAIVEMLKKLDLIHHDLFEYLENKIADHERLLARIVLNENGLADGNYREEHEQIRARMDTFTAEFNMFKKIVFGYIKSF